MWEHVKRSIALVYYLQRVASHCTRLVSGPHMRLGTELIRGVRHCLHATRMNSSAMCAHHLPRAATSSRLSGATNSGSAPLSARYCYIDLNQNFQMRISVPPPQATSSQIRRAPPISLDDRACRWSPQLRASPSPAANCLAPPCCRPRRDVLPLPSPLGMYCTPYTYSMKYLYEFLIALYMFDWLRWLCTWICLMFYRNMSCPYFLGMLTNFHFDKFLALFSILAKGMPCFFYFFFEY
jgi:hypothetical protein